MHTKTQLNKSCWQHLARFSTKVGILSALVMTAACSIGVTNQSVTNAQSDPLAQTRIQPNVKFNVERQAGNCPRTVGLWLFSLGYEGGADHTVVADTQAIASAPAKLVVSQKKQLEYQAPLRSNYASCVGKATSPLLSAYNFQFRNGKVSFRMDVSRGDGYREILYKGISASRPYISWRATE
ncbi:MAG TPA: hypothetical protein V6D12_11800 [Candidatus Obscuribacterales bacterium]